VFGRHRRLYFKAGRSLVGSAALVDGIQNIHLFVLSCILLNLTPGQDTMYIIGRSIAQGKKAGIWSAFGIMSGVLVHTFLAAVGLSAILATSAVAFTIIKAIGAAYLIWLVIGFIRNGGHQSSDNTIPKEPINPLKVYTQGVVTNLFNPKVALFFLSFLPQFADPGGQSVFGAFMLLGLIFFTTGSIWCLVLATGSAWLTEKFRNSASMGGLLKKLAGVLLVGLGVRLVFANIK
jgi:threonine/homoserine/homoserine lactone efflux protein